MTTIEGLDLHHYHGPAYHAWIGNTQFGWLKRSAKYYRWMRDSPEEKEGKDYYDIGNVGHWLVLEPETVEERVYVSDLTSRRGKKWEEAKQEGGDRVILLQHEWEDVQRMADAVTTNPIAKTILGKGRMEVSYFSEDFHDKMAVKCRPDWLPADFNCIVDLKFLAPRWASPAGFSDALHKFGYFRAAAFYLDIVSEVQGRDLEDYFWIVCEKEEPFDVVVYQADPEDIKIGRQSYSVLLDRLLQYREDNEWPGMFDKAIYGVQMREYHRKTERGIYE